MGLSQGVSDSVSFIMYLLGHGQLHIMTWCQVWDNDKQHLSL